MSVLRITDDTTRAELEEAIANLNATLHRMPAHWVDRRAELHAKINALLTDWQRRPDGARLDLLPIRRWHQP